MQKFKLGILKETKNPPDRRVALAPDQAIEFLQKFPNAEIFVQPSELRSFKDEEFTEKNINLKDNLSDCDLLVGVKEVKIDQLIPNKSYLFFSHTAKKQPYNRELLQAILKNNNTLIDHEYLTNIDGQRLVAFGRWAGIVGAYNGLIAYGKKFNQFSIKRAHECHDMNEFFGELKKVKLPPIKILITGGGRVAHGAMETLEPLNIKKVTPQDFLEKEYDEAVYCQIDPWHYTKRKDGEVFDLDHFINHPAEYESTFLPYTKKTDFLIACHFWDEKSPVFMTTEEMQAENFKIKVIADVSCDINGPLPSTVRASTIADPFYDYSLNSLKETEAFSENSITVMAVDNLPGEAPRNASVDFGKDLNKYVFDSFINEDDDGIIERATIVKEGKLTERYKYLQDFADGKE